MLLYLASKEGEIMFRGSDENIYIGGDTMRCILNFANI